MKKLDLDKFNACNKAIEYYNTKESFEQAWNDCNRGDWMLWIASRLKVDLRVLTLAKGKCAETVIHLMKDERSHKAVKAAIDFGMMEIDLDELNAAAAAADAAADDAYAAAAYYAAAAAAAADDDAYAAAATAAAAADAADARKENRQKTADICREVLTEGVFEKIK